MQTTKQISKRILSLMLSALMVVTMLPTFVFSSPTTAEAQDAPASSYWSILASTDFTKTNGKWSGTGDTVTLDNADTKTSAGGSAMGWTIKYADRHGVSGAEVDSNGVSIPWENSNHKTNGFLYMSKFNDQTTNTIFNGVDNFKIDLAFSYLGDSKACTGYELNERRGGTPLIKLAKDSKYSFNSKYTDQANFFCQEAWGRRSVDDDYYKTDGESGTADDSNGPYAVSTYNTRSVISANTVYHYVVYYVDKMIGCYVTDDSGNVIINYNPIEMGSYNMAASVITSIYLGGSEFNWAGKYDLENVAYKSIEIYKGVDSHSYDSTRDKFLYAYFTGNDEAGETMHYAISQDGVNFEAVSGGAKVWNPSNYPATETFPTTDSAPNTSGVDISNHVRDSYAFIGNDGKDYVISTDLNTNNGDWGNIKNSRFLLWKMDNFADIADTKPISIDTSRLPGMDAITNNSQVKKAWAPQAIWDSDMGKYMLYWSVGADGIDTQLYYTYTSDFKSDFTTVKRLMYPDFAASGITNHIDADITYHNGLYYCYFKNEDGSGTGSKRIWYAVAPNANGPYTDFELINTSYGAEGPQVYETGNGSYMLMIDGYGDGTYHMYSAGTPYDFDISDETTTNVTSLSPRHGSIVRISDAEYQKLKKLRIGEELRYTWETTDTSTSGGQTKTDAAGHDYIVAWVGDGITTGGGTLTLNNAGVYSNDTTVQNFIASDVYSVTFNYKSNSSTTRDDNHSIFSISDSGPVSNYVRLSANGKFIVNNSQVAVLGNCSDGTTTRASKLSSAVNDTSNFHRFTITSDGLITSLIIDGEYICGVLNDTDIPNTLWLTFGWARIPTADGIKYEDYRLSAQFGQVVFKNVATETDKQDELYDTLKPANVTAGTFNQASYIFGSGQADSNYYGNLVYSPSGTTSWVDNNSNYIEKDHLRYKYASPANVVGVYDGVTKPSFPVIFESKYSGPAASEIIHFIQPYATDDTSWNARKVEFRQDWSGYKSGWTDNAWPQNDNGVNQNFSREAKVQYNHTDNNWSADSTNSSNAKGLTTESSHQGNTGTPRFWKNSLQYYGSGNTTEYYEKLSGSDLAMLLGFSSRGKTMGIWGNRYHYFTTHNLNTNFYVINYKPVYDILNGTTKVPNTDNMTISQLFANDADNRWMYTKASYEQALYAMKLLNECNPNNFLSNSTASGNVAAKTAECGTAIKKAIEEFNKINLVKNKFNITYRMADGTTKAEVVTAGDALASVPSNTATYHIADSNTHMKNCAWSSETHDAVPVGATGYDPDYVPYKGLEPQANTIFVETGTVEECTKTNVAASGDTNAYQYYNCTVCKYENDDYKIWDEPLTEDNWTAYDAKVDTIATKAADTQYTTSSRAAYETDARTIANGVVDGDPSKSEKYINDRIAEITTAEGKLNPVADFTALDATVTTAAKVSARNTNNYNAGNQIYTYSTWVDYAKSFDNGMTYHNKTAVQRADTPMYATNGSGYVTSDLSTDQTNINTYNTAIGANYTALAPVDSVSAYETFDAAYATVNSSLDPRKYTSTALATINSVLNTADTTEYKTLTAEEATEYNNYTGGSFAAGAKIKNATSAAETPDATTTGQTTAVLSASTTLNGSTNNLKTYALNFSVQNDEGTTVYTNNTTPYYGQSVELTVPAENLDGYKVALWGTTNYEDDGVTPAGSQKASGRTGSTYTKVVSGNSAVLAELEKTTDDMEEGVNRYDICDAYGSLIDVIYSTDTIVGDIDDQTITFTGGGTATAKTMPFYTFTNWSNTAVKTNHYKLVPQYTVIQTYDIDIVGASNVTAKSGIVTSTSRIDDIVYDTLATITSSDANFAAWAVRTSTGKLQIASYNSTCTFYACADEEYIAIVSDGNGGYQTADAKPVAITGANIDGAVASGVTLTADQKTALVNDKITNKKPFIAIQNVKMTDKQARVYARITQGATGNTGYGVLYKSGSNPTEETFAGATKRNVTSALSTGQFTYTLNAKTTFSVNNVTFRTFVNYPAVYKYDNTDYEINGTDYSEIVVATKNA